MKRIAVTDSGFRRLSRAISVAALCWLCASTTAVGQSPDQRVELRPQPGWVVSGAFGPDGESLYLVDNKQKEILKYSRKGISQGVMQLGPQNTGPYSYPTMIRRAGPEYFVEFKDGFFYRYSGDLEEPTEEIVVLGSGDKEDGLITAVYGWVPLQGSFFALVDLQKGPGFFSAFADIPYDDPSRFRVIQSVSEDALKFYLVGNSYLTAIGSDAYYLLMEERPRIMKYDSLSRSRAEFQQGTQTLLGDRKLAALHSNHGPSSIVATFSSLEQRHIPVGLFSTSDSLLVLMRQPKENKSTWWLDKFSLTSEDEARRIPINTSARHLTIIPGSNYWAILEKMRVEGFGQQKIPSILFLPASRLSER